MDLIGETQLMWNIAKIRLGDSAQNTWEDQMRVDLFSH